MKKYLITLSLILCSIISVYAYDIELGNICYNKISDSEVAVTSYYIDYKNKKQDYYSGNIVIPEKIRVNGTKDYAVTKISANAFLYSYGLTSVTIPSSVLEIGSYAFGECKGLTTITIQDGDNQLTTDYYTTIGYTPVFTGSPINNIYIGRPCTHFVFDNLSELETIVFSQSLTDIPRVSNAPKLVSVSLPSNSEILQGFPNTGITQISLPNTIKDIWPGAFQDTKLTSLDLPSGLETIGEEAFSGCSLESIIVPASCVNIAGAFRSSNLKSIQILAPISKIAAEDFAYSTLLKTISIPPTYTIIEHNAFEGCRSLESFVVPNTVETIEYESFMGCTSLKAVTIGNKVWFIGNESFHNCQSLNSVTCLGYTAPIMLKTVFDDATYNSATLFYNELSIDYTSDQSVWNNFLKTVPINPESAGITSVNVESSSVISYTNPSGITSATPFSGLNIVRYSNGEIKKVFIK